MEEHSVSVLGRGSPRAGLPWAGAGMVLSASPTSPEAGAEVGF